MGVSVQLPPVWGVAGVKGKYRVPACVQSGVPATPVTTHPLYEGSSSLLSPSFLAQKTLPFKQAANGRCVQSDLSVLPGKFVAA